MILLREYKDGRKIRFKGFVVQAKAFPPKLSAVVVHTSKGRDRVPREEELTMRVVTVGANPTYTYSWGWGSRVTGDIWEKVVWPRKKVPFTVLYGDKVLRKGRAAPKDMEIWDK